MKCSECGGKMKFIGSSNGAETYECTVCGNQKSYMTSRFLRLPLPL